MRANGLGGTLRSLTRRAAQFLSPRVRVLRGCHSAAPSGSTTAAIHADALQGSQAFSTVHDVSPPLSLSSTFTSVEGGHVYSRISSPTRERAEALLGAIEGTPGQPAHAVLYSSGLAASFAVLARLLPKRVAIQGGYHGTHQVLSQLQRISGGTACEAVPLPAPADVGASPPSRPRSLALSSPPIKRAPQSLPTLELARRAPATPAAWCPTACAAPFWLPHAAPGQLHFGDVIWLETPRNPGCEVSDIAAYVAAARTAGGVRVVVDSTFAPPPVQRPLACGADVVM